MVKSHGSASVRMLNRVSVLDLDNSVRFSGADRGSVEETTYGPARIGTDPSAPH